MRKASTFLLAASISVIAATAGLVWHGSRPEPVTETSAVFEPRKLPSDVEGVMEGYVYNEVSGDSIIKIKGKRVVRRGREMLGLRANLAKTNFLEDLSGTITSKKGTFRFSAKEGEWDMLTKRPMVLEGDLKVDIDGRPIRGARRCRIFIKQGVIEVLSDQWKSFYF